MADTVDGGGLLVNKENFNNLVPNFAFPAEFPYDFESTDSYFVQWRSQKNFLRRTTVDFLFLRGAFIILKEDKLKYFFRTIGKIFFFPNLRDWALYGSAPDSVKSPVDSVVGSTETETDSLAGLTRELARSSLQGKTQNINFAPLKSKVVSLPATALSGKIESRDVVYVVAEQAVRWKINGEWSPKGMGLLGPHRNLSPVHYPQPPAKNTRIGFYATERVSHNFSHSNHFEHARGDQFLKQQCSSIMGRPNREGLFSKQNQFQQNLISQHRGERVFFGGGFGSNARYVPPLQILPQNHKPHHGGSSGGAAAVHGRSGVKRECAGIGVFLPHRYAKTSEYRKKPGCSAAPLPASAVHALNKHSYNIRPQAQICFTGSLVPNYDALMASRKVILTQQKQSLRPERVTSHELSLPQEWTY